LLLHAEGICIFDVVCDTAGHGLDQEIGPKSDSQLLLTPVKPERGQNKELEKPLSGLRITH